ncbi:TlpA family protein disulfide reductase [Membranihabitans maritimus]|uniref:TlpA family protein disulfide reductase n=1 Tax=Membranihabitans maritimus TaxID=2904244 RepID=UPI001F417CAD|nr:TlpA disulfide reductase family protein [Membranihabitans maritimus]
MKFSNLAKLIIAFFLAGQINSFAQPILIEGKIENKIKDTLIFSYRPYSLFGGLNSQEILLKDDGTFELEFKEEAPVRGFISLGRVPVTEKFSVKTEDGRDTAIQVPTFDSKLIYFYLTPGEEIQFQVDASDIPETLEFTGELSDNSLFMNEDDWRFNSYKQKFLKNWHANTAYGPERFLEFADKKSEDQSKFLKQFKSEYNLTPSLVDMYTFDIQSENVTTKIYYKMKREDFLKEEVILPANFYDFMFDVEFAEESADKGVAYFYFLDAYLKKMHEISESEMGLYSYVPELLNGRALYEYYAFALGRDFKKDLYDKFGEDCPYPDLAANVKTKYKHLEGMLEGNPAPSVELETPDGETISLDKYLGKYIYIDFWATWCGPCIKEMPDLHKLEKDYRDSGIVFLSVSYDNDNSVDKWKNFMTSREMTGIQVRANDENREIFSKAFNIKQIPRFVIIDPKGNILDPNAHRPSNPGIRRVFDNLSPAFSEVEKNELLGFNSFFSVKDSTNILVVGENHSSEVAPVLFPQMVENFHRESGVNDILIEFGPSEAYFYNKFLETGNDHYLRYTINAGYYKSWEIAWKRVYEFHQRTGKALRVIGFDFDRGRTLAYSLYNVFKEYENKPEWVDSTMQFIKSPEFFKTYTIDYPTDQDKKMMASMRALLQEHLSELKIWLKPEDYVLIEDILANKATGFGGNREVAMKENVSYILERTRERNYFMLVGRDHAYNKPIYGKEVKLAKLLKEDAGIRVFTGVVLHENSRQWGADFKQKVTLNEVQNKVPWNKYEKEILSKIKGDFTYVPFVEELSPLNSYTDYIIIARNQDAIDF